MAQPLPENPPGALERARQFLPSSILDESAFAQIALLYGKLPRELSTFWGFECRLGTAEARADILFEIRRSSAGHRLLARRSPSSIDHLCEISSIWAHLRGFSSDWDDVQHSVHGLIRSIWLEFDVSATTTSAEVLQALETPCVFWGPDSDADPGASLSWIGEAMKAFTGSEPELDALRGIAASLPDPARIFQIGLMASRSPPATRVCVHHIPCERLPGWLSEIGAPVDASRLSELLEVLSPLHRGISVGLSLTESGISGRIGLECYQDYTDQSPHQWLPLLDYLKSQDLCAPSKREGILTFPGTHRVFLSQAVRDKTNGVLYPILARNIHHVKLSVQSERILGAKAYLGIYYPGIQAQTWEYVL